MADLFLAAQSVPATPSAGNGVIWVDSVAKIICCKNDTGLVAARSENGSIVNQAGFAADTYLTDSDILVPSFGFQVRTIFKWQLSASKTAAGVATPIYQMRIGSARTTADTSRLTLTGTAQTAVLDIGSLTIIAIVRSVGAAGVIQATAFWDHRGTVASTTVQGTGFASDGTGHVEGTSAGFDNSALSGLYVGLSVNGGASAAWTITQARAEAKW